MTNGSSQGLFTIVAVVIFGIFVGISYLLFQDKLNNGLSIIFCEGFTENKKLTGLGENACKDSNPNTEEDKEFVYGKIRDENTSNGETEVWIRLDKKTGTIVESGTNRDMTGIIQNGGLSIPSSMDGIPIKHIGENAFYTVGGGFYRSELDLGDVETIGENAFYNSRFIGEFRGNNLKSIGNNSFHNSNFTGDFIANNLEDIPEKAFYNSRFDGNFQANKVKNIGYNSFNQSKFTGDFQANNVENIKGFAFFNSTFKGYFQANQVKTIESSSFENSNFTGEFIANNIEDIGREAFRYSIFTGFQTNNSKPLKVNERAFLSSKFDLNKVNIKTDDFTIGSNNGGLENYKK